MGSTQIEVGAVFRWSHDDRPIRVLMRDTEVVMYDAWRPHLGTWGLANLGEIKRKRVSYYVSTVSTLTERATYLRAEPLTSDELAVHRPELPLSAAQCAAVQWPSGSDTTAAVFAEVWRSAGCSNVGSQGGLDMRELYVVPFGPNGGQKAGVRVKADNGNAITIEELISKAAVIQAAHVGSVGLTSGVGIYRSGLQRGIPAYYLWGSQSKLHSHIASVARNQQ